MKKIFCIVLGITFPLFFCFSAIQGDVLVKGIIVKFDKRFVTFSRRGEKIKVPRSKIPKHIKIKIGEEAMAVFSGKEIMEAMKKSVRVPKRKKTSSGKKVSKRK